MLYALIITICLAHGGDVECREWRMEPFKTMYECQRERRNIRQALKDVDHHYSHLECERGHYS